MSDDWGWVPWLLLGAVLAFAFMGSSPAQASPYYPPPRVRAAETKVYTNMESWEVVTDRRGRVIGVKGKRRAEQTKE